MLQTYADFIPEAVRAQEGLEVGRGFRALATHARAQFPRSAALTRSPIEDQGYEIVRSLPSDAVPALAETILGADGSSRFFELSADDMATVMRLVCSEAVCAAIVRALRSHFAIIFADASEARALGDETALADRQSFLWHCDVSPTQHLKLMVYLDGPEAHDGATAVLDPATSARFADIGYRFVPKEHRLADLGPLGREAGIDVTAVDLRPAAGEAILFPPGRVLHRGVAPTWGRRRVLTLGLVPFWVPFEQMLPVFLPCIRQNTACDFPQLVAG